MATLLDRVLTNAHICEVRVAFTGDVTPSTLSMWQPFYNSTFDGESFEKLYATIASIDFEEESNKSAAGVSYKQKVVFRFPNSDPRRPERIAMIHRIKWVNLTLSNGLVITVGRNDHGQNTKPTIKTKTNAHLCEVSIETTSIFPSGYAPTVPGFNGLIPFSF